MALPKKPLKLLGFGFGGLIAAATLAGLAGYGWLQSDSGRHWLKRQIETAASTPGELELTIGALEGSPWTRLRAEELLLQDSTGPWLSVQSIDVAWHPLKLIGGRLNIETLVLNGVEVMRLPAEAAKASGDATEASDPRALLDLPVKLRIGKLQAGEIALGEPVIGQAARFALSGESSSDEDGQLSATLNLSRLDGPEAQLALDVSYLPETDFLSIEAEGVEAAGGLIAQLTQIPDLPEATVSLAGKGPLTAWDGSFALSLGEVAQADAEIALRRTAANDLSFNLAGRTTIAAPSDAPLLDLIGGTTQISLEGAWRAGQQVALDNLSAVNESIALGLRGSLDLSAQSMDLALTTKADDGTLLSRALGLDRLDAFAADVAIKGAIAKPSAEIDLRIDTLAAADLQADALTLEGEVSAESDLLGPSPAIAFALKGQVADPNVGDNQQLNALLGEELPWTVGGRIDLGTAVLQIDAGEVISKAASLSLTGTADVNAGSAITDLALEIPDLAVLKPITEVGLLGSAGFTGPLKIENFGDELDLQLKGRWEQPASDVALLSAAAGNGVDLAVRAALEDGLLRIEEAKASSNVASLEAALAITAEGVLKEGRYELTLPEAATLAAELGAPLAGKASLNGTMAGPFDALELVGDAQVESLMLGAHRLTDITANHRLTIKGQDVAGPVSLALSSPLGALDAQSEIVLQSEILTLESLQAGVAGTKLTGRAAVPFDGGDPDADLKAEVADLAPWLRLAGLDGGGQGKLALQLKGSGDATPFVASADLTAIELTAATDAAPLRAEDVSLRLEAQGTSLETEAGFTVAAENLVWEALKLARLDLEGAGRMEDLSFSVEGTGDWIEPFELRSSGRLGYRDETLAIDLTEMEGSVLGEALALRKPAKLTLASPTIQIQDLDLALGKSRLTAAAELEEENLAVAVELDGLPLQAFDAFLETGLEGRVQARLDLQGSRRNPLGSGEISVTGLRPKDGRDLPALNLTAAADWRETRVKLEGSLGGTEIAAASFAADAPLRLNPASGALEMPPNEELAGQLSWSGDLSTLLLFIPLPEHQLAGKATIDLVAEGSPSAPKIDGSVAVTQGRYENLETGTLLRDLEMRIDVSGDQVTLATLTANDGAGGKITGRGEMTIDPAMGFPFDVSIALDKLHALRRDDVTAVAGGEVGVDGTLEAPRVEGSIVTETVEVSLLASLPPDVVELDVTEVNSSTVEEAPRQGERTPPVEAELDLVVEMPRRVFVRGRGLDSEWQGRISVKGSSASPIVTGEMNIVRGQLSVVGKPFDLRAGKVILPKSTDGEARLDVTAVHQGKDLEVTARMEGPLSKPELELTSAPDLPRDEIISRVLFNKSAASLTSAEAAQLALAVQELTASDGTDILGFARRTLGVDVLRVDAGEGTDPSVEAGRYLTDEVYVGVKQGTSTQSSAAQVEIELTPNITFENEVTGSGANKSGVRFQWNY